ncbi:MAG TPA: serine/threonine-protein kinase, partial [Polyangia bacterium]|nr:serine/threonine-protein kinase [Polyangia bacterium]
MLAGRYEVRETIGRGGMGLVIEAFDRMLGVEVAIKILRAEYAGERGWSERLAREVKLARQIHHPNVCRVFDYAHSEGRAFLIMELAGGGTLRDEIVAGRTAARPLSERIADARAIAAGLAAIHAAGIVHRDIAPQNALRMSDGRLVLSDFGLATDSFDGMTSIHGGTIAYMAPEVVGGGRASFASDIWALGLVIHETVFGERLRWDAAAGELRSAVSGRKPGRLEASLLEICRACLTPNPERRLGGAAEIAARLNEAGLARSAVRRRLRRAATIVAGAVLVAAGLAGARRFEAARRRAVPPVAAAAPVDPLMIIPTGEPDDWTDKSKVLAEVPDRIRCMVALPDHHTVRFVWGYPPRAEDLDTHTGKRTPSPLVPDAYAEGCPDLTRDGKKLVYTGHTPDDRAFAFVSAYPDGRKAVPVVPIAEPSMSSDPTWLPDGERFLYELDARHIALFSIAAKRSLVLPSESYQYASAFHSVVGEQVFAASVRGDLTSDIRGFTTSLDETVHFRLPYLVMGIVGDDRRYYCSTALTRLATPLIEVDPTEKRARLSGMVRGQHARYPRIVDDGMAFLTLKHTADISWPTADGRVARIPVGPDITTASRCGASMVATRIAGGEGTIVKLSLAGKVDGPIVAPGRASSPSCSPDGRVLYYIDMRSEPGLQRCEEQHCREIFHGLVGAFSLSPDGNRVAFFISSNAGLSVQWMRADGEGSVH